MNVLGVLRCYVQSYLARRLTIIWPKGARMVSDSVAHRFAIRSGRRGSIW
jgi:hypothetical protein